MSDSEDKLKQEAIRLYLQNISFSVITPNI